MATTVFDLQAILGIDTSKYEEGLKNASGMASSAASSIGTGLAKSAKIGAAAVAAIGTAVVGASGALIKSTADVASYGDNIDKMSQKMGMSASAYQEWDAVMQHCGTSMEAMKASMKTLANAAETGSEAFDQLGISQEQIANMSQEELFEATISALQNVEDETERTYLAGKTLGRGATELGALLNTSAEDTQAMRDRVRELGGVMSDEAVKASAQFKDNLQDLQTAMSAMGRNISGELLPGLNFVMEGFTKLMAGEDVGDSLSQGFDKLGEGLGNVAVKILSAVQEILPAMIDAGIQLIGTLGQGILDNLPTIIDTAIQVITKLSQAILKAAPQLAKAGAQIAIQLITGLAQMLPTMIPQIVEALVEIAQVVIDNIPLFIDSLMQLMDGIAQGLLDALPILLEKLPVIIQGLVDGLVNGLPLLLQGLIQLVLGLANGLMDAIPIIIDQLPVIIDGVVKALLACLPQLIVGIIQLITGILEHLPEIIVALIEAIPQIFMAVFDAFVSMDWLSLGTALIMGIVNGIIALVSVIPDTLVQIGQDAIDWITNMDWIGLGMNLITWIVNGLVALVLNIPKKLEEIAKNAISYVKRLDWIQVGKDIIKGIIKGIADMAEKFIDAIVDLCKEAWHKVKEFFGIESPSKLMAYAGRMIDEGLVKGIEQESALPVRAMEAMAASISAVPMNAAFEGGYGYGEYGEYGQNFNQVVNIYAPEALTPSEIARQTRNATRDMVLELKGRR